jgi:AcrR family transcriptional regulator
MFTMSSSASARPYGGVDASQRVAERRERILEAGLDLLAGTEVDTAFTVRGVCRASGLVARYFYESFADGDALAVAVYEKVVQDLVSHALGALSAVDDDERGRVRVGLASIVAHLAEDPRRGRLMFATAATHPALAPKRLEMVGMFAGLLTAQVREFYGVESNGQIETIARFLVGGFGETLTAWQNGDLTVGQDELVDLCIDLFVASAAPVRRRDA